MAVLSNFVVLEGGDGSGTTTTCDQMRVRFEADPTAPTLFVTAEPSASSVGRLIRSALRGDVSLHPETLARLFAADRCEHLYGQDGILEHCNKGEIVLCDRYVLSSLVYQGMDCGEDVPVALNAGFPVPALLIFFDVDPERALKRVAERPVRDKYEYLDIQRLVYRRYQALLPAYSSQGSHVVYIDASMSVTAVAAEVWNVLHEMPLFRI
jgi:dTMP kinase